MNKLIFRAMTTTASSLSSVCVRCKVIARFQHRIASEADYLLPISPLQYDLLWFKSDYHSTYLCSSAGLKNVNSHTAMTTWNTVQEIFSQTSSFIP